MGVIRSFADGLVNLVANLGTDRDKAAHTQYGVPTLTDAEAVNAYRAAWLPRKIVDIPALDALRNWRNWQAESQQVTALESEEKRLGLCGKLLDTYTKARLFGGAALYIGTGDANAADELRVDRIGKGGIRHLTVLTKRVLQAGEIERDPESPRYGLPGYYTMSSDKAGMVTIHPSRLVILQGAPKPDAELSGTNDGWGDSVLTAIMDEIKRADGTSANIASLVFEAKVDVLKIPNFMAQMGDPAYEADMLKRLQLAAMAKGINGALVLDKEEEYEQKSAQFGSLRDILLAFMQLVSGAADIPVTRLLGQAPGGLNASGEADVRNYYDRIRAIQELEISPAMDVLDECLIRSALGNRPQEVFYNWNSLWQTSNKERAEIGKTTADTIKTLADTALIPDEVLAKVAVNMLTEAGVAPGLESEMDDYQPQDSGGQTDEELAAAQSATPSEG